MSLIKAIRHQLGLSVTPANNFTLDASANNGTMKLARGNAGATTQDIMTVDAAGKVAFPQNVQPIYTGTFGSSGIGAGNTDLSLTDTTNVGVVRAGATCRPTVAGWYQCNLALTLDVAGSGSLGAYIFSTTGGRRQQIQPPYLGSFAVAAVSDLVYCNGTTDTITFGCYSNAAGGSVSGVVGTLVKVRD